MDVEYKRSSYFGRSFGTEGKSERIVGKEKVSESERIKKERRRKKKKVSLYGLMFQWSHLPQLHLVLEAVIQCPYGVS